MPLLVSTINIRCSLERVSETESIALIEFPVLSLQLTKSHNEKEKKKKTKFERMGTYKKE